MATESKEQKFYSALRDVFVGAKVEGKGGFINLMNIKSKYYEKIEKFLREDIEKALEKYPSFRDELFDKLYSFFSRYFTESGSIYFNSTPFHSNIYEKVYTDDRDVILFWKTHMLYYVKTDRIFRSLPVEFDGLKFYFDATEIENKKANEKRSLVFELKEVKEDGTIVFSIKYSEKGTKTKQEEILKALKGKGIKITEDQLERAFKIFEKQSEVDFFINKNAKAFLHEQFKLWVYQYVWDGAKEWTADRINQLQILKEIAFKIIDFISQFEDELLKIWNKPKFVKNSNYVITLDRIAEKDGGYSVIEKILNHENIKEQIKEWQELGIVDESFKVENVFEKDLTGKKLSNKYKHLPIDTKYFKDLELEILGLFDDLDNSLDGWLIKSENYQALNTILPKFREKVQTIYIDPPYNTGSDEFIYSDRFRSSSWLTMMENRLSLARELMKSDGVIFVSIANNQNYYKESYKLGIILENLFEKRFADLVWKRRSASGSYVISDITEIHEYIFVWGLQNSKIFTNILSPTKLRKYVNKDQHGIFKWHDLVIHQYTKEQRPNLFYGVVYNFKEDRLDFKKNTEEIDPTQEVVIYPSEDGESVFAMTKKSMEEVYARGVIGVIKERDKYRIMIKKYLHDAEGMINGDPLKSVLDDNELPYKIGGTSEATKELKNLLGVTFDTAKPTNLIKLLIYVSSRKKDLILDFFAGSGTTAHAVMKLNKEDGGKRKFILVEMADYFETVIIPRIKKIAYSFNWEEGKPKDVDGIGIFFKYYELEQYEETLANCKYEDGDLFTIPRRDPYQEYVFMKDEKMLKALEIDYENNKVKVDLSKLYSNIDIAETLSNLTGKWIKKIRKDEVEFEDGTVINTKDLDYKLIKPLIWWE